MAQNDVIYKLIAQVQGAEDAKKLSAEVANLEAQLKKQLAALSPAAAAAKQYGQAITDTASKLAAAQAQLRAAQAATKDYGYATLQVTNALQDFSQGGLGGILNNIPGVVTGLGGGGGLTAAITVLGIAALVLQKNWHTLMDAFGTGKVKTEAEEMEELRKKTSLTADEAERLYRFEQLLSKTTELRQAKTASEQKGDDTATKAITEAGVKDVVNGVLMTEPHRLDEDEGVKAAKKKETDARNALDVFAQMQAHNPEVDRSVAIAGFEAERKAAHQELVDARQAAAEKITSAAALTKLFPKGPGDLAAAVRKRPDHFGPHHNALQEGLDQAQKEADMTPEERQREKVTKAVGKVWDDFKRDFKEAVEKQAKQNNHDDLQAADAIMKEGEESNEKAKTAREKRQKDAEKRMGDLAPGTEIADKYREKVAKGGDTRDAVGAMIEEYATKLMDDAADHGKNIDIYDARKAARSHIEKEIGEGDEADRKDVMSGKDLKDRMPKLGEGLQSQLVGRMLAGQGAGNAAEGVVKDLAEKLKAVYGDLTDEERTVIARKQVEEAQSDLANGKGVLGDQGGEEGKTRNSQIVGAAEFASAIQTSISGGDAIPKKQLDKLEQIRQAIQDQQAVAKMR